MTAVRSVAPRGRPENPPEPAGEIREAAPYFEEIKSGAVNKDYMQLATTLIKGMTGEFDPSEFHDTYQDALVELVKAKVAGQTPIIVQEDDLPSTFNFAEALKQSLEGVGKPAAASKPAAATKPAAGAKKPPAKSEPAAAKKQQKRKQA